MKTYTTPDQLWAEAQLWMKPPFEAPSKVAVWLVTHWAYEGPLELEDNEELKQRFYDELYKAGVK